MLTGLIHLYHYLQGLFSIVLLISIIRVALNKIPNVKKDLPSTLTLFLVVLRTSWDKLF